NPTHYPKLMRTPTNTSQTNAIKTLNSPIAHLLKTLADKLRIPHNYPLNQRKSTHLPACSPNLTNWSRTRESLRAPDSPSPPANRCPPPPPATAAGMWFSRGQRDNATSLAL